MNEYDPVDSDPNDYESDRATILLMRYCLSLVFCIIIKDFTSPHLSLLDTPINALLWTISFDCSDPVISRTDFCR